MRGRTVASPGVADDGSIADIPWASVFDPDHNARALNAIQARGFRAATDVIERLVNLVDRNAAATEEPIALDLGAGERLTGMTARGEYRRGVAIVARTVGGVTGWRRYAAGRCGEI